MKTNLLKLVSLFAFCGLVLFACDPADKEEETPDDNEVATAVDNSKSEEAVSSSFSTVNHYGINEEGIKSLSADSGVVITVSDTSVWPRTLTIDFGTGITNPEDGHTRRGKIIAEFSGRWRPSLIVANTYAKISYDNFFLDGNQKLGEITATYKGLNSNLAPKYELVAVGTKILFEDGTQVSWDGTRTFDWKSGWNDLDRGNDIFEITGSATGVSKKGKPYTSEILEALLVDNTCSNKGYFIKGKMTVTPQGAKARTVDFGDGTCDDIITVTIQGITFTINLGQ